MDQIESSSMVQQNLNLSINQHNPSQIQIQYLQQTKRKLRSSNLLSSSKLKTSSNNQLNIKPTKLKDPQQHTYLFPIQLLQLKTITGRDQFKLLMRQQAGENKFDIGWSIDRRRLICNEFRIYIRCLICKACINYQQNQDQTWTLLKYKNTHAHPIENQRAYKMLKGLANFSNPSAKIAKNQTIIPMSQSYLSQIKKKLMKHSNFSLLKQLLRSLHYEFKYEHNEQDIAQQGYPQSLVAVSKQQKQNYQKYGECVCYDITYNSITQIAFNGKSFGIGLISGFDNNKMLIVFGFSITTLETIHDFKNIFKWFFMIMKMNHTSVIISNQQKNLIYALKELKIQENYQYHHIYNSWHFIKSFTYLLKKKNPEIIKQIANKLSKIIKEADANFGKSLLCQLKQLMFQENLKREYEKLQAKLDHICLWKMPNKFIGLSLHSNENLNNLLNINLQNQMNLYKLLEKFDKASRQRTRKSNSSKQYEEFPFEEYFEDDNIRQARVNLKKKVFNAFICNYNKSQFYQICRITNQPLKYQLKHIIDNYQYTIFNWECSCGALDKTGLPCQHLIYLYRNKCPQVSYVSLFNQRWLVNTQKDEIVGQNDKVMINTRRIRQKYDT